MSDEVSYPGAGLATARRTKTIFHRTKIDTSDLIGSFDGRLNGFHADMTRKTDIKQLNRSAKD
jgi:hypothetical protein